MKKIIAAMLAVMMIVSVTTVFAGGATIIIDGNEAVISEGMGKVVEKQDRTFVPVRFVLEYLNYDVVWNEEDQTIFCRNVAGDIVVMQIDNNLLIYKGADGSSKTINMDVTPFLNNEEGRTYIPIRFIAEVIGYEVGWDGATNTVTLDKK